MKSNKLHIGINDFIKAIKIADRELEQEDSTGFISKSKIFKNKKKYNRKNKIKFEE